MAVRENQNLTLTCKAQGFPDPKIMWKREDGNEIVLDRKRKGKYLTYIFISSKFRNNWNGLEEVGRDKLLWKF